jgi:hypothetical protein
MTVRRLGRRSFALLALVVGGCGDESHPVDARADAPLAPSLDGDAPAPEVAPNDGPTSDGMGGEGQAVDSSWDGAGYLEAGPPGDGVDGATAASATLKLAGGKLIYERGGRAISLSPTCPVAIVDGVTYAASTIATIAPADGPPGRARFVCTAVGEGSARIDFDVRYEVSAKDGNLRKWATLLPTGFAPGAFLQDVIVEAIATTTYGTPRLTDLGDAVQSYPAFFDGFFAGVEYPVARTYLQDGTLILSHRPGRWFAEGQTIATRTVVLGVTPPGRAEEYFGDYIATARPVSKDFHVNYDTWWTLPLPYDEDQALALLGQIKTNLFDPYGVAFDSFCLDLGWSDPHSIFRINTQRLPHGLATAQAMADTMGTSLGLWVSPANLYSPWAIEADWARENGYEVRENPTDPPTSSLCTTLGGKYQRELRDNLVALIDAYHIGQLKFDGMLFFCAEPDHGHPTGGYEYEYLADGLIDVLLACSRANPDLWIEATCFGDNPSPFWLLYVSSVLGAFGTDAPQGLIPAPSYRESATTGRDYYNLQGSDRLSAPVRYQDVLGLIHQTGDDFTNDAVMTMLRGQDYVATYLNPDQGMSTRRWAKLASLIAWARNQHARMHRTQTLRPAAWSDLGGATVYEKSTMPEEPYGYSHLGADGGLVVLRNPWIARTSYPLPVPAGAGRWAMTSLYPEARDYGEAAPGGQVTIPLAPYETLVLSLSTERPAPGLPTVAQALADALVTRQSASSAKPVAGGTAYVWSATLESTAERNTLMFMVEDTEDIALPLDLTVTVNGVAVATETVASRDGWWAALWPPSDYWEIASVEIPSGLQQVSVAFTRPASATGSVSCWVLASKAGAEPEPAARLPQPDTIYLDSAPLGQVGSAP